MPKTIHELFKEYWETREVNKPEHNLGMGMPTVQLLSTRLTAKKKFAKGLKQRPDYQPTAGPDDLRLKLAHYESTLTGISYAVHNIMLVDGALGGFSLVIDYLLARANGADVRFVEVLPTYPLLAMKVRYAVKTYKGSATVETVSPRDANFRAAIDELLPNIEADTIVYLTNPSNPTGLYHDPDILKLLGNVCQARGAYLVIDESCDMPLSPTVQRSWANGATTIRVQSFAKQYLLAGFRLGYLVAFKQIIDDLIGHFAATKGNAAIVANDALSAYLDDPALLPEIYATIASLADYAVAELQRIPEITRVIKPEGCYYLFVQVNYTRGSWNLFKELVKHKIDVVPGALFGLPDNEQHAWIRICFARRKPILRQGIKTLATALAKTSKRRRKH